MATTGASLQPLKPAPPVSHITTRKPDSSTSQTPLPASANHRAEPHGFGILQHTGRPVHDDIPDLYRDGRVRNPVPSKLKGKTDERNGNFGVMHIDLPTTNETHERDAAAKRTSEGTQLAAKLAQTDHYVPIKRSKFVYRPDHQATLSSPQPMRSRHRTTPLTATETKAEQARLLTLLKGLHPVLVVDQLCKALAFFGGIPGAQGSNEASFPLSAEANGAGSLFVGWLAEIFPALGQGCPGLNTQQPTMKRLRGRPRGSKNAKNKDKALKKRLAIVSRPPQVPEGSSAADGPSEETTADDSWVDVDEAIVEVEEEAGGGRQVEDTSTDTANPSADTRPTACLSAVDGLSGNSGVEASSLAPIPRRRGRPKGSKNRPKDATTKVNIARSDATSENVESRDVVVKKRKPGPGRPKGSKNRPKEPVVDAQPNASPLQPVQAADNHNNVPISGVSQAGVHHSSSMVLEQPASTQPSQTSPHQPAVLPPTTSNASPQPLIRSCAVEPSVVGLSKGVKRKRKAPNHNPKTVKATEIPSTTAQILVHGTADVALTLSSREYASSHATDAPSTENGMVRPPPAKKKRLPRSLPRHHQRPSPNSKRYQAVDSDQAAQVSDGVLMPQSGSSIDDYDPSTGNADSSASMPRTVDQINMLVNHASSQPNMNAQGTAPDLRTSYIQTRGSSGGSSSQTGSSKQLPVGPYSMIHAGGPSPGMYGHARSTRGQYGQMSHHQERHQQHQQQQELRQQASPYNRAKSHQQHVSTGFRQPSSTARQDRDSFDGSSIEGGFHGLTTVPHQPAYRPHVATIESSRDSPYNNSVSRTSPSSSFHARQVQHLPDQSTSFHEYSDQSFMDMANLDSSQQTGLAAVGQSAYNLGDVTLHRSASSVSSTYNPATGLSHSPCNDDISESTLRERMYNTLRRQ